MTGGSAYSGGGGTGEDSFVALSEVSRTFVIGNLPAGTPGTVQILTK